MKTAQDYLAAVRAKNQALLRATKIQMTPDEFLHQIKLAYQRGREDTLETLRATEAGMPDFMKGLFGRK